MKFIKLEQKLQLQTKPTTYTETSYWGTDITNDGVNIIINNAYDPNINDITVAYIDITEPVTATIDELTQILRCWVLEGISAVKVFNSTPWILDADCNALQNVADALYWRGLPIGGGGGGTLTTAYNGLSVVGATDVIIGGTLAQNTDIETQSFRFKIEGNDPGFGFNQGLSINANINQAQLYSTTQNSIIGWDSGLNRLTLQSGSLAGITMTNDGTNNLYFDPAGFTLGHNAFIQLQLNDGAGIASTLSMDKVEAALNFTDASSGAISQHSLNNSLWTASFQSANISRIQLDDNQSLLSYQNGSTAELSRVILESNQYTIDNTDGIITATIVGDASSGIRTTLLNTVTNDYNRMRILPGGIDLSASINGGNLSTLSVTPDAIYVAGGMAFGVVGLSGLMPVTLPPKNTFYFIDTNTTPGTFTFTIPVENCLPGYVMTIKDDYGNASLRTININTAIGQMELGLTQTINTNFGYRTFVYSGSTWLTIAQG